MDNRLVFKAKVSIKGCAYFANCINLPTIAEEVFADCTGAIKFSSCFASCKVGYVTKIRHVNIPAEKRAGYFRLMTATVIYGIDVDGAREGTRTPTPSLASGPKPGASTNFATLANDQS